jgi:sulfur carrier protein ThiS adenylyltransferase
MKINMFTKSITSPVTYRTKHLRLKTNSQAVTDRQERLTGFIQKALSQAKVILIGAGGLGGEIGEALTRKGIGSLIVLDDDVVEPTNLNRQRFYKRDLYKNKARCLARNLAKEGFCGTLISGYGLSFEDALERGIDVLGSVAIVGVDNNPGRVAASRFYRKQGVPVIFTAVSREADHGYVFIQEPGKACFGCLFPDSVNDETYPCPGTPAVKDILKVVAGIVVYAVDTLLMKRLRCWNYKSIFLDGTIPGSDCKIARREDCALCQGDQTVPLLKEARP